MTRNRLTSALVFFAGWLCFSPALYPAAFGQSKTLTIENNSVLPLQVFLDANEGERKSSLGFVDPVSKKTFGFNPSPGRWYVTIDPYAPGTKLKSLSFLVYVKTDKNSYVFEVLDRDFGPGPILPAENVSILGRWDASNWRFGLDQVIEFIPKGDGYVGMIVSQGAPWWLERGFGPGFELITDLKRIAFHRYQGKVKWWRDTDNSIQSELKTIWIEKGRELRPFGWTRK